MRTLSRIIRHIENALIVLLLSVLLLICFVQVAGRLFLNTGFVEADPLIYQLVLWIGLVGAVIASREKSHITIDIISRFLTGRWLALIQTITYLFSAGICLFLVYISIRFIQDERAFSDAALLGIPVWIWQIIMPMSFFVIGSRYAKYAVLKVISLCHPPGKAGKLS